MVLALLYYPPKHPRGIPWNHAIKILDYVGAVLFSIGGVLVLTGVIYTNLVPASSPRVIGLLCSGFAVVVAFALWEHFMPMEAPICPPRIFAKHWGREFTFPFMAATIINMFYYSTNIAYISQVSWIRILSIYRAWLTGEVDECPLYRLIHSSVICSEIDPPTEHGHDVWSNYTRNCRVSSSSTLCPPACSLIW